ncbi:MAG: hypothetical protein H6726_12235 [Sandaracinaceae bacterium]|nr:hypothetical protein [Sandaracinaceae bacterium]
MQRAPTAPPTEPPQAAPMRTESLQAEPMRTESLQAEPMRTESLQAEPRCAKIPRVGPPARGFVAGVRAPYVSRYSMLASAGGCW